MRRAILAAIVLLSACAATPPILVSQPGQVRPQALATYEFRSSEAVLSAGAEARRSDARLAETVARRMAEKGYVAPPPGSVADFVITYRVAVFAHENPRDAYAQVRDPTSLIGTDIAPDPAGAEGLVREATLVVMALSTTDGKVIWQATASGVATGPKELTAGAARTVDAMLDRFPARER